VTVGGWDGRGLPPAAGARIERATAAGLPTSLLSAGGLAGLERAGFEPAGEVLGTAVMQVSWLGYHGCGWQRGVAGVWYPPPVMAGQWFGYEPYSQAIRQGLDKALTRMRDEAAALGADGVVGVRLTEERIPAEKIEFTALGTAVRSRGRQRPERPFTTDLAGQDLAKLLAAGWMPAAIVYGLSVAVRHDDSRANGHRTYFGGNTEVTSYTELLTHVRAAARQEFAAEVARLGGDGALMSGVQSRIWPVEATGNDHRDNAAECLVTGNAITQFHPGHMPITGSLTVLPLPSPPSRKANRVDVGPGQRWSRQLAVTSRSGRPDRGM
jgi:uncharacterized protein YbjQ (UPF0145 family)